MNEREIDATLMNKWLGDKKITDLSPKTLYDIQTLIEYYRDVIVPNVDVKVGFPVEGIPCADTDKKEIFIPYHMLKEGRVDETIGAMIHELRHIEDTPVKEKTVAPIWSLLNKILNSLKLDNGKTIAEVVFSDSSYTLNAILREPKDDERYDPNLFFLREACGVLFGLANATEDVRIDTNTPPNLKKYIDKIDKNAFEKFEEARQKGDIEDWDSLHTMLFRFIFHHKGYYNDPLIEKISPTTEEICEMGSVEAITNVFDRFRDTCQEEVAKLFNQYVPPQPNDGDGEDLMDMFDDYVGDMVNEELQNDLANQAGDDGGATKGITLEEKSVGDFAKTHDTTTEIEQTEGEKTMSHDDAVENGQTQCKPFAKKETPMKEFAKTMNADARTQLISAELNAQIQNFSNIQVHTTTENFGRDTNITYDTVIFDATK